MAELFERTSIGSMSLPNRFVRSATWEGLADKDGSVTGRLTEMMIELSGGTVASPEKFLPVRPGKLKTPKQEVPGSGDALQTEGHDPADAGGWHTLLWRCRGTGPKWNSRLYFNESAADLRTIVNQALAEGRPPRS